MIMNLHYFTEASLAIQIHILVGGAQCGCCFLLSRSPCQLYQ